MQRVQALYEVELLLCLLVRALVHTFGPLLWSQKRKASHLKRLTPYFLLLLEGKVQSVERRYVAESIVNTTLAHLSLGATPGRY